MKKFLCLALSLVFVSASISGCSWFRKKGGDGDDSSLSESDLDAQREGRFGSGSIPSAEGEGVFRDIHFDYDSSAIDDLGRQDIDYNIQIINANPEVKIQLEGHCDERGTNEYNLALGQARARAVQEILTSYGVSSSKLSVISYGEEVPLDPGHSDSAFAKNRRVHFSAFRDTPGGNSR
jgi:peptidoglycan-associated lipoprotein